MTEQHAKPDANRVIIFDTTLRDGEQSPGASMNLEEKLRIAAAIAVQIPDHASIFVHYGTTMEAVGTALRDHNGLLIVTNNLSLANNPKLGLRNQILLAGGKIAPNERCTCGEGALTFLRQFNVDFGLISARAVEADGTIYDHSLEFAETARVIIENARQIFLALDSRKFHRHGLARVGHVRDLSAVFTDKKPPVTMVKLLADHGVALHVAKGS